MSLDLDLHMSLHAAAAHTVKFWVNFLSQKKTSETVSCMHHLKSGRPTDFVVQRIDVAVLLLYVQNLSADSSKRRPCGELPAEQIGRISS